MSKIQKFDIDQETRSAEMVITAKTPEEAVQIAMERLKVEGLQGCGIAIVTVDESGNAPETPEPNNLTCDCANCKNSDCDNSGEDKEVVTKEDERLGRGNTNPFILSYGLDNGSECPCPACQVMRDTGFTMSLRSPVLNPANTIDNFLRGVLGVAKKPSLTPTVIKNRNKTHEEMAVSIAQNSMYGSFSIRPVIFEPTVEWEAHVNNFTNVMHGNKGLENVLQEEASQPTFGSVIEEQNKDTVEFIKHTENVFQDVMDELVKADALKTLNNRVYDRDQILASISAIPNGKELLNDIKANLRAVLSESLNGKTLPLRLEEADQLKTNVIGMVNKLVNRYLPVNMGDITYTSPTAVSDAVKEFSEKKILSLPNDASCTAPSTLKAHKQATALNVPSSAQKMNTVRHPEPKEQSWEKYVNHPEAPSLVVIPLYGTSRSDFYNHYYNELSNLYCKIEGSAIDNMANDFSRILEIIKDMESNGDISDINSLNASLNTAYGRELVWNNIYIRGINANLSPEMRSKKLVTEVISLVFGDELKS